ncbi:2-C-methyl-D-erythritol 4-phosphate cytidylyltransferase [Pseudohongiella spirulinae]|uniref:2-C-methyl-D-erythritol 4-phosphate cytidylyltransferase n=2 Tax=Pseudohongiella spirulinae TaxID=1249552 RepID=A0A0S2KCN6_9GAMM|nr:2-C-methyl-D-erythritol 4-phosphate cytidylyltransferase [Pseudohongiella spirulinae]
MQSDSPKQYLDLAGRSVLERTLEVLLQIPELASVTVVLNPDDTQGPALVERLSRDNKTLLRGLPGGQERWQSVANALQYLHDSGCGADWVLVHDAARPCVLSADIRALIAACELTGVCGGLLAVPVTDTLKRVDESGHVQETPDRSGVWAACTPQMFRVNALLDALVQCRLRGLNVTDEASAMELQGYSPVVVRCHRHNIKITYPEDLPLAALILQAQTSAGDRIADNFQALL